jgi:hypothetical protein
MQTGRRAGLFYPTSGSFCATALCLVALFLCCAPPRAQAISPPSLATFALEALDVSETRVAEDEAPTQTRNEAALPPAEKLQPTNGACFNAGALAGTDGEPSSNNKNLFFSAGAAQSKRFSFFADVNYRIGALDFDFGAGRKYPRISPAALANHKAPLDHGAGNSLYLNGTFKRQPAGALRLTLDYTRSRLVRGDTGLVAFDSDIYLLRSTYQFTRFLFAHTRADDHTIFSNVRGQFLPDLFSF